MANSTKNIKKKQKKTPQQEHTKIAKYYDVDIWMNI